MFTKGFAIKIGRTTGDRLLADLIKKLANRYSGFTVENLTHARTTPSVTQSVRTTIVNNTLVREVNVTKKKNEYLTVGFSNTFDVSFEAKSDIYIGGIIPAIKIYDINKDFIEVVLLLKITNNIK